MAIRQQLFKPSSIPGRDRFDEDLPVPTLRDLSVYQSRNVGPDGSVSQSYLRQNRNSQYILHRNTVFPNVHAALNEYGEYEPMQAFLTRISSPEECEAFMAQYKELPAPQNTICSVM